MDPTAIYIEDLPKDSTYCDIKDSFCPFQRSPPLQILKIEHYAIITFQKAKTVRKILRKKDQITLKGKTITIKQAYKQFEPIYVHLPPSFHLPINVLFPPFFIPIAPPPQSSSPPPLPSSTYIHPFPQGFSYLFYT